MAVHRSAVVVLQGSRALLALSLLASGIDVAVADVPMLTRHASFDGDLAMRAWTGGSEPVVGSASRPEIAGASQADAQSPVHADIARRAGERLFKDGFQPPAR